MRNATFLVAVMLAVALSMKSTAAIAADPTMEANRNTANFLRDAINPYAATAQPSSQMHMHDHHMHHHMHHHHHHRM